MKIENICVYCGSSNGKNLAYSIVAKRLGKALCERNIGLVYGGAAIGIMGVVANSVIEGGGRAIGVIPKALAVKEVAHNGLSELHVVGSMHERKAMMAEYSDGFIALPGGWGTLEEIFEILTWAQLGFHEKPCGLLNVDGYYNDLVNFLDHAFDQKFVNDLCRPMLMTADDPADLLGQFSAYKAPGVRKWVGEGEL